jgi:hypothetical protein
VTKKIKYTVAKIRMFSQHNFNKKSYRYLGIVALTQINTNIMNKTLLIKKIKFDAQPDQNIRQKIMLDENIFKYSPKKKNANAIEEYSVL